MPISTVIAKKIYAGNDVTTEFPFAYRFFATSDLVVEKYTIADGTLETLTEGEGEDYTVVGGDDGDGGTTDYTSGGTVVLASALEDEYKLIITRVLPLTQTFDFAPNSPFSEDSFEEALDRMIAIVQQQQAEIDRCIKMDKSYSSVSGVFDVDDLEVSVDDFVIDELTAKTTIGSSDYVPIADGDASNVNKKILASSIININGLTEDASLHANDVFLFEDSQASYAKKKVTRNNLVNINSLTEKTTLASADLIMIEDSAASNVKKKVQKSNIASDKISKTTAAEIAAMTEKSTLADADLFLIEDSAASNAKKKVQFSAIQSQAVAGTTLVDNGSADTQRIFTETTYTKYKEFQIPRAGEIRIKFTLSSVNGTTVAYAKVYKNDVAFGDEQGHSADDPAEYSQDISGWSAGDFLSVYVKKSGAQATYIENVSINESAPPTYILVQD